MKENNGIKKTKRPGVALACITMLSFALTGAVAAQNRAAADDGIAASPKVRAALNERKAKTAVVNDKVIVSSMRCAKCKDVIVSIRDTEAKGLGARTLLANGTSTKAVAKHLCPTCDTKWALNGVGKATKAVAVHNCGGAEKDLLCCASPPKVTKK